MFKAKCKLPPPPGEFYPVLEIERLPGLRFVPSQANDYRVFETKELERLLRRTLLEGMSFGIAIGAIAVALFGLLVRVVSR